MANYRKSNLYRILKLWINAGLHTFYRFEVHGRENLPKGKPFIITPNHENALVDAVIAIIMMRDQPYSVARAGAFQNPMVAKFLTRIRMFPIYRPQDGMENMYKNEEIMRNIIQYIKDGQRILIYPEGDQALTRRLRPLKKGVFRMALAAEKESSWKLDLQLVPTGVVYEEHAKMGRSVVVTYGKPICVEDYYDPENFNEARLMKVLREKLFDAMRPLMMDIPSADYNDTLEKLRLLYVPQALKNAGVRLSNYTQKWKYDQSFVRAFLNEEESNKALLETIKKQVEELNDAAARRRLRLPLFAKTNWPIVNQIGETLLLAITLPLFVMGFLLNIIPYKVGQGLAKKVFKHKNFEATGLFFFGLLTHSIWYWIFFILVALSSQWFIGLYFVAFMYASGKFAFLYSQRVRKWAAKWRFRYYFAKDPKEMKRLAALRQELFSTLDSIWKPNSL